MCAAATLTRHRRCGLHAAQVIEGDGILRQSTVSAVAYNPRVARTAGATIETVDLHDLDGIDRFERLSAFTDHLWQHFEQRQFELQADLRR
jgi:hypothetical protein